MDLFSRTAPSAWATGRRLPPWWQRWQDRHMEENKAGGADLTRLSQRAGRNTWNSQRCLLEVICMHARFHFYIMYIRDDVLCLHHSACYFKDLKMLRWHLVNQFYFAPAMNQAPCRAVKKKVVSKMGTVPIKWIGETDNNLIIRQLNDYEAWQII